MKPAPPAASSLKAPVSRPGGLALGLPLREVAGEAVAPGGQEDRVLALAGERREGGPPRRPPEHVGGRREDLALDLGLVEDLAREVVPGDLALGGHVVDAEGAALDQAHDPVGEV